MSPNHSKANTDSAVLRLIKPYTHFFTVVRCNRNRFESSQPNCSNTSKPLAAMLPEQMILKTPQLSLGLQWGCIKMNRIAAGDRCRMQSYRVPRPSHISETYGGSASPAYGPQSPVLTLSTLRNSFPLMERMAFQHVTLVQCNRVRSADAILSQVAKPTATTLP